MKDTDDKTRTPQQDRSIKTKQAIVTAAMELFSNKGYHQTNTKQIAAAAGVSTGSFYSYFTDKKAVFIEVLKYYNEALLSRVDASLAEINFDNNSDKKAVISHLVDSLILSHQVYTGFHKELSIMQLSDDEIKRLMDEQYNVGRQITLGYLQLDKEEVNVADVEAAAIVVFESVSTIVDAIVFSSRSIAAERLKSELVNMIAKYLYD
ncbi:TetR/AcrR family transcriptional regulator [Paenibacillus agri]|uniref:TetR/AcrR family transcriptional regulator n=1 Tax=Paenibacillus agri TaxID=2744309 RepID=A0A850EQF9_9BACL|nr:TetR/AcrR family transcriptional regulator [Paenibacillus agri]NUU63448.1 TetR/AcrR family transcriptional regulator [Paenibacillus agri]